MPPLRKDDARLLENGSMIKPKLGWRWCIRRDYDPPHISHGFLLGMRTN
jgi:hypothetical protein